MAENVSRHATGETVLEMRGITKLYAGTVALHDVNFSVERGEVHGLIGKNGAGKSTLVSILSGIIQPSSGEIIVNGNSFSSFTPIIAKRNKISIITQEPQTIAEGTVMENLFMPIYNDHKKMIDWNALRQKAHEILTKAGLPIEPDYYVRDLSISAQQLMLVVKTCYVEDADIIIMDEVSASLTQADSVLLYRIIEDRVKAGKTVIFISHHTKELLNVCDRVTVLRDGKAVGTHKVSELDLQKIAALIVGKTAESAEFSGHRNVKIDRTKEPLFELRDFTRHGKFADIFLKVYEGEIVGIAGLRGAGRTEIFKSIVGADRFDVGQILYRGKSKRYKTPEAAIKDGIVYMAEEREREGLIPIASIKSNMSISVLDRISSGGIISAGKENTMVDELMKHLDVKAFSREQEINQLSGGNKQKVMVGKVIAQKPVVCLLDEPTRGVDIDAKESILHSIDEGMREGSCVILSSPGIDDLMKICDRIVILYGGRIIDEFQRGEYDEETIYRATQGEVIHKEEAEG